MKPSGFNIELDKSKQAKSIAPQKGICKTKAGGGGGREVVPRNDAFCTVALGITLMP